MKVHSLLAAGALVAASVLATASPAAAADATLEVDNALNGTSIDARAWWDDSIDTLCVKAINGDYAVASVRKADGTYVRVYDYNSADDTRKCTGNLSIKEDYYTDMTLCSAVYDSDACVTRKIYT